ncbi:hypothetical protein PPERSA_09532 [Pseudocohnilembus persalinus]|uniref:Papain family cysteine protease n=1 Tax=Pseudocohnilembus persalinus TaxID=266149 RepID=A0A0V0QFE1_PSEPJ|nr:hypothetical protein PPERSA_09532 [Pseudocohnilembus persalinus]|eukprot:KRX00926.1 hypothetical protein PPERSA_09532 [Pseudocohnilembus persalinus]
MNTSQTLILTLISLLTISGVFLAVEDKQNLQSSSILENNYEELFDLYNNWKMLYGKQNKQHSEFRFNVFVENYQKIMTHNAKKSSYKLGFNKFADLTDEEFTAQYLLSSQYNEKVAQQSQGLVGDQKNPKKQFSGNVDFRKKGVVNPVQSQGSCGSCYTFAAAQALESAYALQTDKGLLKFSEQQLTSCSQAYGNNGCGGGFGNSTFSYVIDHGITLLSKYPYVSGKNGEVAACKVENGEYYISSYTQIVGAGHCLNIQEAAQNQPLYARVIASDWKLYDSGIFDGCVSENPDEINHGVGIVGFNTESDDSDKQYWIIRNSWGEDWGEKGYMRLQFGNSCAICNDSYFPTV